MPDNPIQPLDLDPKAISVLQRYKLVDANGKPGMVNLHMDRNGQAPNKARPDPNHKPIGVTPRIDPAVLMKFVKADKMPDRTWLDWMINQAAGGEAARERSQSHFDNLKARKIDNWRRHGFVEPASGKTLVEPMDQKAAEKLWKSKQAQYWEMFEIADDDVMANFSGCYGFKRAWPGPQSIYEKLVDAVTKFQAALPQIKEYNKLNSGEHKVSTDPQDYANYEGLLKTLASVNHYFSAQEAYDDVDYDLIRDDEMVTVLCPLTYRAAVEYGWDEWEWANRDKFEKDMRNVGGNQNGWRKLTAVMVPVIFMLKTPVPGWPTERDGDAPQRYVTLANMMTAIPISQLKNFTPDALKVLDEENDETRTWHNIIQMILNAAPQAEKAPPKQVRPSAPDEGDDEDEEQVEDPREATKREIATPEDELSFVKPGASPYKNAEEAQKVANHLQQAMADVSKWAKSFNPARLHSDFLEKRKPA